MSGERLQKVLSQAGLGSRRVIEQWITEGWIEVNGMVAVLGPQDKLKVKGKVVANPLQFNAPIKVILYHKPVGEISSRSDPKFDKTVFDNLPKLHNGRWVQVGRLDLNTSGLLLFTNNGELAERLMHARYALEREYAVRIHGMVTREMLMNLQRGIQLEDGMAKFKTIESKGGEGTNHWYHVVLEEGRNREVRRLWESQGVEVSRLIRIRFGDILLPRTLARGKWVEMDKKDLAKLLQDIAF